MVDSFVFLLLVPGLFVMLAAIFAGLAVVRRPNPTAAWGATAFLAAATGATVDVLRQPEAEWMRWLALALHFVTLLALSNAFLARRNLELPRIALFTLIIPVVFIPLLGFDPPESVRVSSVQMGATLLTGATVVRLARAGHPTVFDRVAMIVLAFGALSYLVRFFLFGLTVQEDSAGRFFNDFYNVVFHLTSAVFGFLSGLALLVSIGMDAVLLHARQSVIDPLTSLGNRRGLDRLIDDEAQRKWRCGGVVALDMDNFKQVNDSYGHAGGDRVLEAVARALSDAVGQSGHLFRVGGEEFVLFVDQAHKERVERLACTALDAIRSIGFDGPLAGYRPTASVGFYVRTDGATLPEAMRLADRALYRAKDLGRDRVIGMRLSKGLSVMTEASLAGC
ncbi:GGDEF domain-containing protein [Sphingomicrobium sp. XHP0235]|uniref:GGDEF domain-containing protein n=1 Tax=Sphingomicrobium aquimarinum TaxID=3133971 RepID=UPI0031FEB41E